VTPKSPKARQSDGHKGRSSARTSKQRTSAMEEDLGLAPTSPSSSQHLEVSKKGKEGKGGTVARLREQVRCLQDQLAHLQRERDQHDSHTAEAKATLDKLQAEHHALRAAHNWTKSSLDSALAAQEDYRKGYNQLRSAFKKAKEDLQRKEEEVANHQTTANDLEKVKAELAQKEQDYQEELAELQAILKRICHRQREKSFKVLTAMVAAQGSELTAAILQAWAKVVGDMRAAAIFAREKADAIMTLQAFRDAKKIEASQVLERMSQALATGLLALLFQYWLKAWRSAKQARLERQRTQEQRLEALKAGGQKMGRHCSCGKAAVLVDCLNGHGDRSFMSQVLVSWIMFTADATGTRVRELQLEARYAEYEAKINRMKQEIAAKLDALDDISEELAEGRRKNHSLKTDFKAIMDIQVSMDLQMKDFEDFAEDRDAWQ